MRLLFAGTPAFAVPSLEALLTAGHEILAVYTQPDRPAGRGRKQQPSPVKVSALAAGLPVLQPVSLRAPDTQQALADWKADALIVVAYGLILPEAVLRAPTHGCLNVHASLLPRWRGAAPIQRAILAGDTETGITLMQMDAGLDTGAMLQQATCPIAPEETAASLHDRLAVLGADTLIKGLAALAHLTPVPQDNTQATYASKIHKQEARIDWHQPANDIARQIRAFNPWPAAFTGGEDAPVKIWQAHCVPGNIPAEVTAGQIVKAGREGIDIATGAGQLRIEKLQWPGGRILTAAECLNARQNTLRPGHLLE